MAAPVLEVRDLGVELRTRRGDGVRLRGVSFDVHPGECVAVLGSNGAGKSLLLHAIVGLVAEGRVTAARLRLANTDLTTLTEAAWRSLRGSRVSLVTQEPNQALDPYYSVGSQVADVVRSHYSPGRRELRARVTRSLIDVGVVAAEHRLDANPSELSAGTRQRVQLAMALVNEPDLLLLDDPATCIDVGTQRHLMDHLGGLRVDRGLGLVVATHDLAMARECADHVIVLHEGLVIESGSAERVLSAPAHPETAAMLASAREPLRAAASRPRRVRLEAAESAPACPLVTQCELVARGIADAERCAREAPPERAVGSGQVARCHHAGALR